MVGGCGSGGDVLTHIVLLESRLIEMIPTNDIYTNVVPDIRDHALRSPIFLLKIRLTLMGECPKLSRAASTISVVHDKRSRRPGARVEENASMRRIKAVYHYSCVQSNCPSSEFVPRMTQKITPQMLHTRSRKYNKQYKVASLAKEAGGHPRHARGKTRETCSPTISP